MHISRRDLVLGGGALVGLTSTAGAQKLVPTSEQALGPFYPIVRPRDEDADLTRVRGAKGIAKGNPINVIGRLVDLRGRPVSGVRLDLWQANSVGRYDHPGDGANPAALDPNFQGFARLLTDRDGNFKFRTIKPSAYNTPIGMRTPHIHFDIHGRSERLVTQMYFPGEVLNEKDFVLRDVASRAGVIAESAARLSGDAGAAAFKWTVVLAYG
ncbi:MAG: protocatechuate 3,4-dioxygenase [Sphingomonas sp.]|nr:protocatechuate 3,4-dioxygenase [Sphingomonas sp.]